ncbi:hypothetical protein [Pseudaminobacter soli (ex Li et al. 2025)]|uniref:Uncharacterized protein n=1 Tax=Pseudaminobacter soli (ex Li et al. 2025) TaxID=1295366 RepID=A0A2P7RZY9_9HYPH|nr:hypothetical protein [Mesorhizobium soli]PSJ55746.1 hypothetical protein C7I85_26000 [Mesorhizobium soli]
MNRCLMLPRVWQPRDPETVCTRIQTEGPSVYFEITLTPEEAEAYALDLLVDARRAKGARASREWIEKIAQQPH